MAINAGDSNGYVNQLGRPCIQSMAMIHLNFSQRRLEINLNVTLDDVLVGFMQIKGSLKSRKSSEGVANQRFISTWFESKGMKSYTAAQISDIFNF